MMNLKEFAVPFGILSFALWIWLFRSQWPVLMVAFLTTVVAMIAMYRNEEVVQMVVEPKRVPFEMQRIEKNVFAKVEEVRRLAEQMGELTAFNLAWLWRFPPGNPEEVRLQERDRLAQMLSNMGIPNPRIQQITAPVTKLLEGDLARKVWEAVPTEIYGQVPVRDQKMNEVRQKLNDFLLNSGIERIREAARIYLEPLGVWTDQVQIKVAEFEQFRRTGQLPKR